MNKGLKVGLGVFVGISIVLGGIMYLGNHLIVSSEAYPAAITHIKNDKSVHEKLEAFCTINLEAV